tara:strand:+ start:1126 stop:1329 length:204 start_codon:yes stop_codon:yes gene_type:complete
MFCLSENYAYQLMQYLPISLELKIFQPVKCGIKYYFSEDASVGVEYRSNQAKIAFTLAINWLGRYSI